MGFGAQGCPQRLPAAGPRPWAVRGAQPVGSSHGAPLSRREKMVKGGFNGRVGTKPRAGAREVQRAKQGRTGRGGTKGGRQELGLMGETGERVVK